MNKLSLLGSSALRSALFIGMAAAATPAFAQTTTPTGPQDQAPPASQAPLPSNDIADQPSATGAQGNAGAEGQQIVVTGTRINRPNLTSTVPITSVGPVELTQRGSISLGDALNELPSLRATFSQANSTRFIGTAALNLIDLRGLGTTRTLVLINGRRSVTSTPGSYEVDVNTIPADLLERVDIVTGGNSAIYGSDAVAGVVNFVLKKNFNGISVRGQGGVSTYGDRGTYSLSGVAGKNFMDGRFNVTVALAYDRTNPVYFIDRPYTGAATGVGPAGFETVEPAFTLVNGVPTPVPNRNNNGIPNTRFIPAGLTFNTVSLGGTVLTSCPAATPTNQARVNAVCTGGLSPTSGGRLSYNYVFDNAGNLIRNDPAHGLIDDRAAGGAALFGLGASGLEGAMLMPGLERYAANLMLNGEISPAFKPFLEASYVHLTANQTSTQPTFIASRLTPTFSINNPFLTPDARATLQTILAPGATTFSMQRFNNDIGTRAENHLRETYRVVVGADGAITDHLKYEVSLNYGRTRTYYTTGGNVDVAKFNKATDAVLNAQGQIVCRVNQTAVTDPACVPINVFGQYKPSQQAIDYVIYKSSRREWAEQRDAIAYLSGDSGGFFNLPGGPVSFVLGGEYRREAAYSAYDAYTASGATFLNGGDPFTPPAVEVKEGFGELNIPLLKDTPFFHELSLDGAARYSDYGGKTKGVWAWNVGAIWAPVSDIRFRVSYARAVRAPNLGELYATASQNFANGLVDPCSQTVIKDNPNREKNCAAAGIPTTMVVNGVAVPWVNTPSSGVSFTNSGNPNLVPEVSKSLTVGAVFQPHFVPGFSLTVDYYDIKLDNVISGLSGQQIVNRCYDDPGGINNPFCALVFRRRNSDPLIDYTFVGQADRSIAGLPNIAFANLVTGPAFINAPLNFARRRAKGIDFDASYRHRIFGDLMLNLRGIATYLIDRENFSYITDPARSDRIHGVLGDPIWRASFYANLAWTNFDITYRMNYIGKQSVTDWEVQHSWQGRAAQNPDAFPFVDYPEAFYHNVRLGIKVDKRYQFYMGVDNIFNRRPPYDLTGTGGGSGIFPNTGRFFYAGFETKF